MLLLPPAQGNADNGKFLTHSMLQAVDLEGRPTNPKADADPSDPANRVVLEGIVLNNPDDMLDMNKEWQIFVQGEGTDKAGTAVWAGRFYYPSQEQWYKELERINASGFRAGDRVRVSGWANKVGGKVNISERHSSNPAMDFEISVIERGVDLPYPEETSIAELNRFDPTRETGGERYTSRRIKLSNVCVSRGEWRRNGRVLLVDQAKQTIPLRLGNHPGFNASPPGCPFDLVALGNQEPEFDGQGPVAETGLTDGYEVWLTDPGGIVLPSVDQNPSAGLSPPS